MVGFFYEKNEISRSLIRNVRMIPNEESSSDSEESSSEENSEMMTYEEENSENFHESEPEMMTYEEMEEIERQEEIEEQRIEKERKLKKEQKKLKKQKQKVEHTQKIIKMFAEIKEIKSELEKEYTNEKYNSLYDCMIKFFKFVVKYKRTLFKKNKEIASKLTSYLDKQIDYFKNDKNKRDVLYSMIYNIVIFKEED